MIVVTAKHLIPKGYTGMAIFPFIILRDTADKNNAMLINHERIHLRQQLELLILPFFLWYFAEYLLRRIRYKEHFAAYRRIGFEEEAYSNEQNPDYLQTRTFWKFLDYIK